MIGRDLHDRSSTRDNQPAETLTCLECTTRSTGQARGWRALVAQSDDLTYDVGVYCPECAAFEFDGPVVWPFAPNASG